jgi:hypothetical protein
MTKKQDWLIAVAVFVVGGTIGWLVALILPDWVSGAVMGLIFSMYLLGIRPTWKRKSKEI